MTFSIDLPWAAVVAIAVACPVALVWLALRVSARRPRRRFDDFD